MIDQGIELNLPTGRPCDHTILALIAHRIDHQEIGPAGFGSG
jgi:hypothetical protein